MMLSDSFTSARTTKTPQRKLGFFGATPLHASGEGGFAGRNRVRMCYTCPMNKSRIFQGIFIILLVIGLYFLSHKYDLYFMFWWIDWAQHLLGGIGIGMITSSMFPRKSLLILGITFIIGVSWEVFERIGHIYLPTYLNYGGIGDTLVDILCAIIGTSLVFLMTRD